VCPSSQLTPPPFSFSSKQREKNSDKGFCSEKEKQEFKKRKLEEEQY